MRLSLAELFVAVTAIAVLLAIAAWWRGAAILLISALIPSIFFRIEVANRTRRPILSVCLLALSLLPLYVASLGPYYYFLFHSNGFPSLIKDVLASFYWPLLTILESNNQQLLTPFFEYYLSDWIEAGRHSLRPRVNA